MKRVIVAMTALPASCLACSGPGVVHTMSEASLYAYRMAATNVVLAAAAAILCLVLRNRRWLAAQLLLIAVHPAWTISAGKGDCGEDLRTASRAFLAISMALLIGQSLTGVLPGRRRRSRARIDSVVQ